MADYSIEQLLNRCLPWSSHRCGSSSSDADTFEPCKKGQRKERSWNWVWKVTFGCQEYSLTENSKVDSPIISGGRELTTVSENVQTRPYKLTEWAAERSLSIAGQAVRPQRIWFSLNEHHNCSYVSNVNSIRVLLIIGYAHKKLYSKLGFLAYHLSRTQSVWHSSVLTIINGQEMNLPFFWLFLFCIKILTT